MENQHKDHESDDHQKHLRHVEETNRENEEIEKEFPADDTFSEDGAIEFPSERENSTDELNPNDQTSMTTETGVDQADLDYDGFTDEERYASEEAGEAGGFTSVENDAALEERIANDQNRQGGGVNLKSTNEPAGRPEQDGEETENL